MSTDTTQQPNNVEKWIIYFKKYKTLILSILVFVFLDLMILLFNFYISYRISHNATIINIAAEQEVLSQQISKDLLLFERAYNKSIAYGALLSTIEANISTFDQNLNAFDKGGELLLQNDKPIIIDPVTNRAGREAINAVKPMWQIYKNYTMDLLNEFRRSDVVEESLVTIFSREYLIKSVVVYIARNNVNLLKVMGELTHSLENVATAQTRQLRAIQLFGIFLAVLNFIYIMRYSLKKIQRKDESLTSAKKEVEIMLNAITEGVVLIDRDLIIREHYSTEMEKIFNRSDFVGKSIIKIMRDANCNQDPDVIRSYAMQWFNMAKSVQYLTDYNPIAEIEIYNTGNSMAGDGKRHLTISFARIYQQERGGVAYLLVRFKDITHGVQQYIEMTNDHLDQEKRLNIMSALIHCRVDQLPFFFHRSYRAVERMRQLLISGGELASVSASILQVLQPFKSECQESGFALLTDELEALESTIRDSMLSGAHSKGAEMKLNKILDKLAVELEFTDEVVSNTLGNRWREDRGVVAV